MLIRMAGLAPMEAQVGAYGVPDLMFAERFALWTFRLWMKTIAPDGGHRPLLDEAYRKVGAPGSVPSIDASLWVLKVGAHRGLDVSCPCAQTLTCDEMRLLHVLACHQKGAMPAARPVLERLLPPSAARAAARPMGLWAQALEQAQLCLPMRDWDLPELRGPSCSSSAHRLN